MNNIIKEELNKFKLLMNYNTKITLSENLKNHEVFSSKTLINENKSLLRAMMGVADEASIAALKQTRNAKYLSAIKLLDDPAIYGATGFKSADEVLTAMAKGGKSFTKAQSSALSKSLLKKGTVTGTLRKKLTDVAADMSLKDPRYIGKSGKEIRKILTGKGYDKAISDEIAAKVAEKNLKVKKVPIGPDDVDDAVNNIPNVPKDVTTWQSLKKWGLGASLTIGAIAIIYSLTNDDELVYSEEDGTIVPKPKPINPGQSRYRNCDKEPRYTKGCRTRPEGPIGQVQACLGGLVVDGKFWDKTQAALEDAGYPNGFTIEEIKTICGNQTKPEEVKPLPQDDELLDVDSM